MYRGCGTIVLLALGCVHAQQPSNDAAGARELFYFAASSKEKLPPVTVSITSNRQGTAQKTAARPQSAGAVHLGLRYNLALVTSTSSQTMDADHNFHRGDCVAIDFETNRSGYLYVMAQQSSGDWLPLLPSPDMPEETNVIDPGGKTRVPKGYCFEISDPPGVEKLFVVLSRDPQDVYELNRGIRGRGDGSKPTPSRPNAPMLVADAGLVNSEVQRMEQQFGTRDLIFRKVDQPVSTREPAHSMYVVSASDKPVTHITAQILIRHR